MSTTDIFCLGKHVYLSQILKEHLLFVAISLNDPKVNQYLSITESVSLDTVEESWTGLEERKKTDAVFSVCLKSTSEVIGIFGLHNINAINATATMGCYIGRKDLWGKGYGTEAQLLLLGYAFITLGLHKVTANVHISNIRSRRSLEKCGYRSTEEGLKDVHYSVRRGEFLPLWQEYINKSNE